MQPKLTNFKYFTSIRLIDQDSFEMNTHKAQLRVNHEKPKTKMHMSVNIFREINVGLCQKHCACVSQIF